MVVFTCGHCGESVQKPKVEKHYLTKCRNRNPNLSCMDCFKDFLGKEYETHIKCITEEQRYSGKGFVAKPNKGEQKQNAWVEMVQSVLEEQKNAPKNILRIIEEISKHTNTPRKKPRFINFVKNVCGHRTNQNDIEGAWDMISVKLSDLSKANNNKSPNKENGQMKSEISLDNSQSNELSEVQNDENDGSVETEVIKTKKQRKEEKKRKKYEAELQSAGTQPIENEDEKLSKKDKKKKRKIEQENTNGDAHVQTENNNKGKKRNHNGENGVGDGEELSNEKVKNKKRKLNSDTLPENGDDSLCLHDQNVAATQEMPTKKEKFDWDSVILAALQKKGNELPYKRLQKKVLAEYVEVTGNEADDRIAEKLSKRLKGLANVKIDKNRVYLVE